MTPFLLFDCISSGTLLSSSVNQFEKVTASRTTHSIPRLPWLLKERPELSHCSKRSRKTCMNPPRRLQTKRRSLVRQNILAEQSEPPLDLRLNTSAPRTRPRACQLLSRAVRPRPPSSVVSSQLDRSRRSDRLRSLQRNQGLPAEWYWSLLPESRGGRC